jgi:hypothetical protein
VDDFTSIDTNASRTAVMAKSINNHPRGHSSGVPKWIKPQLCKLVDAPPQGSEWLHEIKYDGYRMHARLDRGGGPVVDAHGPGLDAQNHPIAAALSALPAKQAYLDRDPGWEDLVQLDPDGFRCRQRRCPNRFPVGPPLPRWEPNARWFLGSSKWGEFVEPAAKL